MNRIHLRTRVFLLTALFGAMLLAATFLLTWRARQSHHAVQRLVTVEFAAARNLEEIGRQQGAFARQWRANAGDPAAIRHVAERYRSVTQLLSIEGLQSPDARPLQSNVRELQAHVGGLAPRWATLRAEERERGSREVDAYSRVISRLANDLLESRRANLDTLLPELERAANNTMWVALAVAWIIAVASFAVARITLARVVAPVENLVRAAERIASGSLDARAPIAGDHEIASLGETFNRMAAKLEQSQESLQALARTDELTGLPNFRAFHEAITGEIERATRYEHVFGLLVFDLDHFKKYNDRYGHLAGNEALQAVSRTIRMCLRAVDVPARYGGEEFAAIIPQTDPVALHAVAERIRASVEAMPPLGDRAPLTVSIGGALFPSDGATPAELFAAADSRLYEAKAAGRNAVMIGSVEVRFGSR